MIHVCLMFYFYFLLREVMCQGMVQSAWYVQASLQCFQADEEDEWPLSSVQAPWVLTFKQKWLLPKWICGWHRRLWRCRHHKSLIGRHRTITILCLRGYHVAQFSCKTVSQTASDREESMPLQSCSWQAPRKWWNKTLPYVKLCVSWKPGAFGAGLFLVYFF